MQSLSPLEIEKIFDLVEKITGTDQTGAFRKESMPNNVLRRIQKLNLNSLKDYLSLINEDSNEFEKFISAITIHKTGWFREYESFNSLKKYILSRVNEDNKFHFKILSNPCSIALCLELIKEDVPNLSYEIHAEDIDPLSIKMAKLFLFNFEKIGEIPSEYKKYLMRGKEDLSDYFTISNQIRSKITFNIKNIFDRAENTLNKFDIIFCRNLLIYFRQKKSEQLISKISSLLEDQGALFFGLTEIVETPSIYNLRRFNTGCFVNGEIKKDVVIPKILIIDDNKVVRFQIKEILESGNYECFLAEDCFEAEEILEREKIDLITLDLLMPKKDGDIWLAEKRYKGIPIIMVTNAVEKEAERVLKSLQLGALDYISKDSYEHIKENLLSKIPTFLKKEKKHIEPNKIYRQKKVEPEIILIGASTGGTEVLKRLLFNLPKRSPPIIVVQHILASFSKKFAQIISEASGLELFDFNKNGPIRPGQIGIPLEEKHLGIKKRGDDFYLYLSHSSPINSVCPSIDFLFDSAPIDASKVAVFLLTGMGKDGVEGITKLKKNGAMTFVQDERSSTVFGMPKAAIEKGAAGFVGNVVELRSELIDLIRKRRF